MDERRWLRLMAQLSLPDSLEVYQQLRAAYGEPQRVYHTEAHITDCLQQLDQVSHLAQAAAEIELSLWFHDAIYQPQAEDNEAQSAAWAVRFLGAVQHSPEGTDVSQRISQQILATQHHKAPQTRDVALVVDIDLSILGRDPERFAQFEVQIRQEYLWVPEPVYRQKRSTVLRSFLERSRIFATEYFRRRYEPNARRNLTRLLGQLAGS